MDYDNVVVKERIVAVVNVKEKRRKQEMGPGRQTRAVVSNSPPHFVPGNHGM
jgi:hypothetical protein